MPQPRLHGPHVDPGAEPAGCRGVAKAVEVPFFRIEARESRDLLATVVEVAVVEVAFRGAAPWLKAALVRRLSQEQGVSAAARVR
jgi:hypothetical protein